MILRLHDLENDHTSPWRTTTLPGFALVDNDHYEFSNYDFLGDRWLFDGFYNRLGIDYFESSLKGIDVSRLIKSNSDLMNTLLLEPRGYSRRGFSKTFITEWLNIGLHLLRT